MERTTHLKSRVRVPLFILCVFGTLALGSLSGLLSGSRAGYSSLLLPPATPPDKLFPIVWTVLYVMIGASLFFIQNKPSTTQSLVADRKTATALWIIGFCFNLFWPFAFFTFKLYAFSFIWLALTAAINLALTVYAFKISYAAGIMLCVYEAWLLFAGYLNLFIAILN